MTRRDLTVKIGKLAGINQRQAYKAVNLIFEIIKTNLVNGDDTTLKGFGKFTPVKKGYRMGRNPYTGEPVAIPARKTVKFKASPLLNKIVEEGLK